MAIPESGDGGRRAGCPLVVDWDGPHGPWDDRLVFVFDAGTVTADQAAGLRPTDEELAAVEFVPPEEAAGRLRADMAERLARALRALREGDTDYSELRPDAGSHS